jgi:NADH-quinone oxidoreductase subunit N
LQVCFVAFEPYAEVWAPVLGILAIATMTLGNLTALQQTNVVRLMAYSSVGHAGYMLVPFGLAQTGAIDVNEQAFASVMIYLLAYAVMNTGAFSIIVAVTRSEPSRLISSYAGLGQRAPGLAAGLTMFLLSLGGIPVFVGFWAKFFIFVASVEAGRPFTYVLAAAVVVNSVIAMFYYLNLIRLMWMGEPASTEPVRPGFALNAAVVMLAAAAVAVFFVPDVFARAAQLSTLAVGG